MGYIPVKNFLRRNLGSGRTYARLRRVLLLGQYILRLPDEPELRMFKLLAGRGGGLIVDVGANAGQSAFAFAFLCPSFSILSFEPNAALWPELDFAKRMLGERFEYRRIGLGESSGEFTMYVPHIGDLPITTRGSLDLRTAVVHRGRLKQEVGKDAELREVRVQVVPFDDLGLRPSAIKIDVEGFELAILKGMRRSLDACRPMLMLEQNADQAQCEELLRGHGYEIYRFDMLSGRMSRRPARDSLNWFAIPAGMDLTGFVDRT